MKVSFYIVLFSTQKYERERNEKERDNLMLSNCVKDTVVAVVLDFLNTEINHREIFSVKI